MLHINVCVATLTNDDSPLILALHSATRNFIISKSSLQKATSRGDSPCLVTGAVVSEQVKC